MNQEQSASVSALQKMIPFFTICIWGSLYIASGIVLKQMPAMVLLFLRFSSASVILYVFGRKQFKKIEKKDWKKFILVGFTSYFLTNAFLLLGIQYTTGSFSSLINATSPVLITIFAVTLLKEQIYRKDVIALALSMAGAIIVIGAPSEKPSSLGVFFCIASVLVNSYATTHLKRLTAIYPALQVTAICMGIAALLSAPTALIFLKVTGSDPGFSSELLIPIAYICVICTAFSHFLWNSSLNKLGAAYCASFYPMQPIVSFILGIILLHDKITLPFVIGLTLIVCSMMIHSQKGKVPLIKTR